MTEPNNAVHLSADYSAPPDLKTYDILLCNISGGKDSQAMLDVVVEAAKNAGVGDRVVTAFCDLGDEDEWPGTKQLAAEHAAHYCVRHEIVFRQVPDRAGAMRQQGLTEHIESRRQQKWPDKARRFCTSSMKRAPVHKLMTRLVAEKRAQGIIGRRVRILNVMGMRAEESIDRAAIFGQCCIGDIGAGCAVTTVTCDPLPQSERVVADLGLRVDVLTRVVLSDGVLSASVVHPMHHLVNGWQRF